MNSGDLLISWTIRFAMLLLVVVLTLQLWRPTNPRLMAWAKVLWSASFVFSVLHVIAAFHFVHRWSHQQAYLATANETRQKLGFEYGEGVYFNYLFLAVWALDVYWIWRLPNCRSKLQKWLAIAARSYLLFIAFNGVVVFRAGWLRILGGIAAVALLVLAGHRYRHYLLYRCKPMKDHG